MTSLRAGAVTDVGRVRTNNEDQLLVTDSLFAVADGMGGHAAGEVASLVAVDTLRDAFAEDPTATGLVAATRAANSNVIARANADASTRGMGTTLCAAALVPNEAGTGETLVIVNVGDSRAYLLRDGELGQITEDHSVADELMRAGQLSAEDAATDRRRHVLTRVLGMDDDVSPDRFDLDPFRGDRLLLSSDGLTNEVPDAEIASIMRRIEDPGEAARELVRVAKTNGGADNITVVIIDVVDDDGRAAGASEALAKDPPRPRGLITSAQRDLALRDLADGAPVGNTTGPAQIFEPVRRMRLRVTIFGFLIVAVIAAGVGAFLFAQNKWTVRTEADAVALFSGRGGVFGEQRETYDSTVDVSKLTAAGQEQARREHTFKSRSAAEAYIARLRRELITTTTTSTTLSVPSTTSTPVAPTTVKTNTTVKK